MPDPTLSPAQIEAYAVAPAGLRSLVTAEIMHPSFSEPIRVVRNFADVQTWLALDPANVQPVLDGMSEADRKLVGLVARLEDTAPLNDGQMVAWTAMSFDVTLPDVDTGALPEGQLSIDNVGRDVTDRLTEAAKSQDPVEVIVRVYHSDDISTPQNNPPLSMLLSSVSATMVRVTGRLQVFDFGSRVCGKAYTASDFPALVT